ncbi:zinc ribbon domain-containing protein [Shewanella cyperi]|uniref:zinc ribbon domain-containing protein n=1 Tax=Shewanella cyperi TaxID=2814292 RepID=UPI001A93CE68|nr:zinc ribbon domain-containing protein [Shewanella cyperi]QSX39222.1 zinc ribbon domain-containing protein [Shewanella cyperi]
MALIQCPVCGKRISSKAKQCAHCSTGVDGDMHSRMRIAHIQKTQRLMNQSFVAMTLFIAGVVIWFWGGEAAEGIRVQAGAVCFSLGFIGYLITRVQIVLHKRKSI